MHVQCITHHHTQYITHPKGILKTVVLSSFFVNYYPMHTEYHADLTSGSQSHVCFQSFFLTEYVNREINTFSSATEKLFLPPLV